MNSTYTSNHIHDANHTTLYFCILALVQNSAVRESNVRCSMIETLTIQSQHRVSPPSLQCACNFVLMPHQKLVQRIRFTEEQCLSACPGMYYTRFVCTRNFSCLGRFQRCECNCLCSFFSINILDKFTKVILLSSTDPKTFETPNDTDNHHS